MFITDIRKEFYEVVANQVSCLCSSASFILKWIAFV